MEMHFSQIPRAGGVWGDGNILLLELADALH